jgi:HAD superfamily hydrolase (TIGR01509 family)
MSLQALIFDVDGTIAETEELHRQAFNQAFIALGLPWSWSQSLYKELLRVTGGKERILHYLASWRPQDLASIRGRVPSIYELKTRFYISILEEGPIELRPGVARLIEEARASGIRLAIATTTNRANVAALLRRTLPASGETTFHAIVAGDEVNAKKPAPEVFEIALRRLRLPASSCIVIEDSRNGVVASRRAGLKVIATPSVYSSDDDFNDAHSVVSTLGEPDRPHQHLAGWSWPNGCVTLAALQSCFLNFGRDSC